MNEKVSDFLVFSLYGAMASWGDIAVGEHRLTHKHPNKSSVLGLIAASLGIRREQDESHVELDQCLGVSTCVRLQGEYLSDWHTAQVPSGKRYYSTRKAELSYLDKKNTILSKREYVTDAFFQIAIWQKNKSFTLDEIKQGLLKPHFTLYLGRKSCPIALPIKPEIMSNTSLKNAYTKNFTNTKKRMKELEYLFPNGNKFADYYWEEGCMAEIGMEASMILNVRDGIYSRSRWQFFNRKECYCSEEYGCR